MRHWLWMLPLLSCDVGNELLQNPSFDQWCGEVPCHWEVEAGATRPTPTWHRQDLAATLVTGEVILSQRIDVDRGDIDCVRLLIDAEAEGSVDLSVEVDASDDGWIEHTHTINTASTGPQELPLPLPSSFDGVLVRIRKAGGGTARLLEVRATDEGCAAPLGQTNEEECLRFGGNPVTVTYPNITEPWSYNTCGECAPGDCDVGETCRVTFEPGWAGTLTCEPTAGVLGDVCSADTECASGVCCDHFCAECCQSGDDCTRCEPSASPLMPNQCDPGEGQRATGAACVTDDDCQSGTCAGRQRRICNFDSRPCNVAEDCLLYGVEDEDCVERGVLDGRCQ